MAEGSTVLASDWLAERLAKFKELREKREEAVIENFASTKQEDAELRVNPRNRARLERKRAQAEEYLAKQAAEEAGQDLERENNLTYTLEDNERWTEKLEAKETRRDPGFTDFVQLSRRKYEKQTAKLDTTQMLRRTKAEAVAAMASEVAEDQKRRQRHSRRRRFDDSEDITYINERNAKFNRKAARAYGEYTEELRESVERGTAV